MVVFYPEDNPITFGKNAVIPAEGWFVFGVVADIHWDKDKHVLTKKIILVWGESKWKIDFGELSSSWR